MPKVRIGGKRVYMRKDGTWKGQESDNADTDAPEFGFDYEAREAREQREAAQKAEAEAAEQAKAIRVYEESEVALEKIARQAASRLRRVDQYDWFTVEIDGQQVRVDVKRIPASHPENKREMARTGDTKAPFKFKATVHSRDHYFSRPYQLASAAASDMRDAAYYAEQGWA